MRPDPIIRRELMVRSRGYGLMLLVCILNTLLFMLALLGTLAVSSRMLQSLDADYGAMLIVYALIATVSSLMILFICPSLTAGSISGERESKTLDLLLTTKMSPLSIVMGKLAASLITVLILIVSSVPAAILPLMYGGVGLWDMVTILVGHAVTAILLLSVGIFAGAAASTVQKSTALAYAMLLALLFGPILIAALFYPFLGADGGNAPALILMLDPLVTMGSALVQALMGKRVVETLYSFIGLKLPDGFCSVYVPFCFALQLLLSGVLLLLSASCISPKKTIKADLLIEKSVRHM